MKLKEVLASQLSDNELQHLVGSYDVVGDIAVVIIPPGLAAREPLIGAAILASNRNIRVVAKRSAHYGGEFRTLPLTIIAGEDRTETEVREFGIRLRMDVREVYFSVRSGGERRRIASLVQPGENVLVLFSGIGPYPLMISRYSLAEKIVGVEKNPVAHEYGLLNMKLNRKLRNIELIHGDVRDVLPRFNRLFDRLIMVLPKSGKDFLQAALSLLTPGGWLHFYDMQDRSLLQKSVTKVDRACRAVNRQSLEATVTICGHCAPRLHRICVNSRID